MMMPLNITYNHSNLLMPLRAFFILRHEIASKDIIFYADLMDLRQLLLSDPCPRYGCDAESILKCVSQNLFLIKQPQLPLKHSCFFVFFPLVAWGDFQLLLTVFLHSCNFLSSVREIRTCPIGGWHDRWESLRTWNEIDPLTTQLNGSMWGRSAVTVSHTMEPGGDARAMNLIMSSAVRW